MYCITPSNVDVYIAVLLHVLCIYSMEISFVHPRSLLSKDLKAKLTGLKKQFEISIAFEPPEFELAKFDSIFWKSQRCTFNLATKSGIGTS